MAKKILLVDDEADIRAVLRMWLEANCFEVLEAADGFSAIAQAKEFKPDLILLDIVIPGKDGIQVYAALRQQPATKGIPIVFLTALSEGMNPPLIAQLNPRRSYWMIGKPCQPEELLKVVRQAMMAEGEPFPFQLTRI